MWDSITGLFDAPFSSTGNTLGILGLSVAALFALWVLCGFVGAIIDIVGGLLKKFSGGGSDIEDASEDDT